MSTAPGPAVRMASRARQLRQDWRLLFTVVAICCATAIAILAFGFSGGLITARSISPGNVFTAGTLNMQLSTSAQLLDHEDWGPGVTRQAPITVTLLNGRGELELSATHESGNTDLAGILDVTITQIAPGPAQQVYDDPLSDLYDVELGRFWALDQPSPAPDGVPQRRTYQIQVAWPSSVADEAHENETMFFTFDWLMVSS